MIKERLVVALLLLATLGNTATAAEDPEHKSKNARKVLIVLNSIGADSKEIKEFVEKVDSHIDEEGYYTLSERRVPGGKLTLHYELGGFGVKQAELKFTPDDSDWRATVRTDRVMVSYSYKFSSW